MARLAQALCVIAMFASPPAGAGDGWSQELSGPIVVRTRPFQGSVKEIWAEADLNASVQDVQAALMDPASFVHFMPYVRESRLLRPLGPDGSGYAYVRLELPLLTPRDYVVRFHLDQGVAADGSGAFKNRWEAVPDMLPHRPNVIRLRINQGSWAVFPRGEGHVHVVYRFAVDPGGLVLPFAADWGNRSGIPDTLKAVEREAQRRALQRREATARAQAGPLAPPGAR